MDTFVNTVWDHAFKKAVYLRDVTEDGDESYYDAQLAVSPPNTHVSDTRANELDDLVDLSLNSAPTPAPPSTDATATAPVVQMTTQLRVAGMMCATCVGSVEKTLLALTSVTSAKVHLLSDPATVVHDAAVSSAAAVSEAVADAGQKSHILDIGSGDA